MIKMKTLIKLNLLLLSAILLLTCSKTEEAGKPQTESQMIEALIKRPSRWLLLKPIKPTWLKLTIL